MVNRYLHDSIASVVQVAFSDLPLLFVATCKFLFTANRRLQVYRTKWFLHPQVFCIMTPLHNKIVVVDVCCITEGSPV